MNRGSFRRLIVAAGGVVVASVARADAPGYGSGDPQYGAFDSSYIVIKDNRTGLTWQRTVASGPVSFVGAQGYCGTLVVGTTTGWRVPSYKELLTLVDESPHFEFDGAVYKAIDSHAFGFQYTPIAPPYYWSSSLSAASPTYAYLVDFRSGETVTLLTSVTNTFVRCVHD